MKNKPLMNKKEADKLVAKYKHGRKVDNLSWNIFLGKSMHDDYSCGDPTYWSYADKKVEDKIKDNKKYKVWYVYSDAADPCDMTTHYYVYYVEEIPKAKLALMELAKEILKNI